MAQQQTAHGTGVGGAVDELRLRDLADEIERLRRQVAAAEARIGAVEGRQARRRFETGIVRLPFAATTRPVVRRSGERVDRGVVDGRVSFREAFVEVPEVHIGLSQLDVSTSSSRGLALAGVSTSANTRITVYVTAVDEEGFDYEFYSWADTHVFFAAAEWIALGGH